MNPLVPLLATVLLAAAPPEAIRLPSESPDGWLLSFIDARPPGSCPAATR